MVSGCWRPIVRGETPTATKDTSTITPNASSTACQVGSTLRTHTTVTRTAAAISLATRIRVARLR